MKVRDIMRPATEPAVSVSPTDSLVRYAESREGDGAHELNVRDAMAPTALTIRARRPLHDLARELADEKVGALPVVDADGKLLGIVSYLDALRALAA